VTEFNAALKYAFLLLKYRARSTQEIVERLGAKRCSPLIIKKVLVYLEEHKLTNDKEFARLFVSSSSGRGWGKRKIEFKLLKLGISKELSAQTLRDTAYYKSKLREIIEKKLAKYGREKSAYPKLLRYLGSRGFEYNEIVSALQELDITIYENC
jgi:regulatory protein